MNNIAYLVNAVENTISASIADTFACYQHTPSSWVVALICIMASVLVTKKMCPLFSEEKDVLPEIIDGLIYNEDYLKESLRLSELILSELNLTMQSHEKKALAIIAGAAAVIGFFLTGNLCEQLSNFFIPISLVLYITSIYFAILTLDQMAIGYNGIDSYYFINYYHEGLSEAPPEDHGEAKHDIECRKRCALYVVMLKRQQEAITASRRAAGEKSRNLAWSTLCVAIGIIFSVGWLLVTALQVITNS